MTWRNGTALRPPGALSNIFAILLVGLMAMMGTFLWVASPWVMNGMMGSDHMGGMMGGGGRDASADSSRQGTANETIVIDGFAYAPGNLQVPAGAAITWVNRDSAPHSATEKAGVWDTGVLGPGKSVSLTFASSGTFEYYCTVHPNMKARLVVQ